MTNPTNQPQESMTVGSAVLLAAEARGQGLLGAYPMAAQVLATEILSLRGKLQLALDAKNELETELLHATQEADELRALKRARLMDGRLP